MTNWVDRIAALQAKRDEMDALLNKARAERDERVKVAFQAHRDFHAGAVEWSDMREIDREAWRSAVAALDAYDREQDGLNEDAEDDRLAVPSGSIEAANAEHLAAERGVPITDSPFVERG